jgi:large subunit ribosomal protein L28
MHSTLCLFAKKHITQHLGKGLLGGIRAKYLYPIKEPKLALPSPPKPLKIKKKKETVPWKTQPTYKQSLKGLYGGKHIQFGNQISEYGNKSRRTWKPNVQKVKLYSEALNERITIKCTPAALKYIDRKGGLDRYMISMKDKELGKKMYDLKYKIKSKLVDLDRERGLTKLGVTVKGGESEINVNQVEQ